MVNDLSFQNAYQNTSKDSLKKCRIYRKSFKRKLKAHSTAVNMLFLSSYVYYFINKALAHI